MLKPKIINFFSHLTNRIEPEFTFRLVDIVYSPKHGHEICVMQLSGKNIFPKFTAEEILSNPSALVGLSSRDAVRITQLDYLIKERKKKCQVLEVDKNGSILLKDSFGRIARYSEKYISSNRDLLNTMKSDDAHDLGYRVGFRDGFEIKKFKKQAENLFRNKLKKFIPYIK
ncbi:hypothetical protein [Rickettsiella endosymbiont of Dermanyssus gallinae]|uniref:hypothetical protein n=1 Tax=Rickettsiella endosymbiont of Dermanyssus gallinae TaxID=2856608 RepID=UPI001C52DC76|nr:hypothetical protein [Rickettsiella endosymbiont of Dermanyssus gallinae]